MDGKNLNEIQRSDPSLGYGKFTKVYESDCPVEYMITEQNIIEMVGDNVTATENMQFKILVKGKDQITPREHKAQSYDLTKKVLDGDPMDDDLGRTTSAKNIIRTDIPNKGGD